MERPSNMKRWGFIGAGKMATAWSRGCSARESRRPIRSSRATRSTAARTALQAEAGIAVFESNLDVVKHSDVLVLAVKPQSMSQVLAELRHGGDCRASGRLDRGGDHD